MRTLLVIALSTALTGSLFLTQYTVTRWQGVAGSSFTGNGNPVRAHPYDSTVQKLDQLVRAYADVKGFNGSVLVASHGTILLDKGYGWRDAARKLPNNGRTRYQIASTTKTFTATMVLRLAEEGKLALTDRLSRYYPPLPFADSVTIEQLLTHTSGIYDFTREPPIDHAVEHTFIDILQKHPLDFVPGTSWRYSNSNYVLLGFIVGKLAGSDYFQAVRKQIFEPLNMTASGFDFAHLRSIDKAVGYLNLNDTAALPDVITDSSVPAGAGSIYSTVEDLYRWHQGLEEGWILSKTWQKKAYQPFQWQEQAQRQGQAQRQSQSPGQGQAQDQGQAQRQGQGQAKGQAQGQRLSHGYGYGWTIDSMDRQLIVSHSGAIAGFGSDLERVPEDDVCVVVLSNKSGSTADVQDLSRSLLAILYDQPYAIPKKWTIVSLPVEQLQTYTGLYDFPQIGLTFRLWVEDGALHVQSANRPGLISTLLPTGNDHFVSQEGGDAECWIDRSAGTLTFTQRGKTFTGHKNK
jgi:CubicO group peptidase (beta-lactamase class C family)